MKIRTSLPVLTSSTVLVTATIFAVVSFRRRDAQGRTYIFRESMDRARLRSRLRDSIWTHLGYGSLNLLFGVLGCFLVARTISVPIEGLEVAAERRGAGVRFHVADKGPGLPRRTGVGTASWIGLELVSNPVEQLGGQLGYGGPPGLQVQLTLPPDVFPSLQMTSARGAPQHQSEVLQ